MARKRKRAKDGSRTKAKPAPAPMQAQAGKPMREAQPMAGDGSEGVSPEEQAAYDTFVKNGMRLIYNEQALPALLKTIGGDGQPVEGLANALVSVVTRLDDSATKSGIQHGGDVMMHGATELLEQMAELSEAAGLHSFTPEEMESALWKAFDLYRETRQSQGRLPVEEIQQDMAAIQQADQAGAIDQILPGVSEFAQKAGKGAQPAKPAARRGLMPPGA